MSQITSADNFFKDFVTEVEKHPGYVRPRAFGLGIAHVSGAGQILDTWFPFPNFESNYGTAAVLAHVLGHWGPGTFRNITVGHLDETLDHFKWLEDDGKAHPNVETLKNVRELMWGGNVGNSFMPPRKMVLACFIPPADQDDGAKHGVADAYLRLHLLSHRLVKPNSINLDGIFGTLPNNYWTNQGPVAEEDFLRRFYKTAGGRYPLLVHSRDKFPRMLDYVQPSGVRVADANRVRLGAYLGEGTTVMHEGFVNFNAGTLGKSMVEGRISAGVVVGNGSDIGGGASIMGTLSGGGKEVITIGENCLIGANAGTGISLGDYCTIEAGLYITAAMKIHLEDGTFAKAADLSGQDEMLFKRDSRSGMVKMERRKNSVELNKTLHKN